MRYGVFGGTFDPPHVAHRALIAKAIEQLDLDELIVIPAGRNPLKGRRQSPKPTRFEMAQIGFSDMDRVCVSNIEINRDGPSYALDTMLELNAAQPGSYWFVLGGDSLKQIGQWKQPDRLLRLCRLAVAIRPPQVKEELLQSVPRQMQSSIDWLDMEPFDCSATEIRERVGRNLPIDRFVTPAIADYINEHKLYRH